MPEPEATVAEMARVAQRWLLVSVPREPLWRGLNMARGAYLRELGNTPGHVNHWSKRAFVSLLVAPRDGRGGPLAVPVDHAACPPRRLAATAAAPRSSRSGSASPGWSPSATSRSPATRSTSGLRPHQRCCGRRSSSPSRCSTGRSSSCSRARSPTATRAGCAGREHLRVAATIQLGLGVVFVVAALLLRGPLAGRPVRRLGDALLDPDRRGARLRGELLRARLPGRPPPLRALRRAGADGGQLALMFALAVAVGIAEGQTAVALGMAAAPIVSLAVVPLALARGIARRRRCTADEAADGRGAGRRRPRRAGRQGAGVHARPRQRLRRRGAA